MSFLLHLAFYNTLGFHRDELLYFSLGQHLSAGYASVPPFTGFIAWLMIHTLGYSLLAARIVPMLLSGAFILLGAAITRELKGTHYAQILVAIAITVTPINLRGFYMLQPVCFDFMFWSIIFWLTLKWINIKEDKYLLLLGLAAGLGMLNKYLVSLEIFGLLLALAFSPYHNIFKKKAFYLAILIALAVFHPNIIWQLKYHLPLLTHMRALRDSQLVHVNRLEFFSDQVFIGSMAIITALPGIIFLLSDRSMKGYLPDPVCFSESFFYWIPRDPNYEIKNLIYINDELGADLQNLFADCQEIGKIRNPLSREYGTGVWLCTNPRPSINKFWKQRVTLITNPFQ
jgi:hypothetical protein